MGEEGVFFGILLHFGFCHVREFYLSIARSAFSSDVYFSTSYGFYWVAPPDRSRHRLAFLGHHHERDRRAEAPSTNYSRDAPEALLCALFLSWDGRASTIADLSAVGQSG
jgi:hypothetical protein